MGPRAGLPRLRGAAGPRCWRTQSLGRSSGWKPARREQGLGVKSGGQTGYPAGQWRRVRSPRPVKGGCGLGAVPGETHARRGWQVQLAGSDKDGQRCWHGGLVRSLSS